MRINTVDAGSGFLAKALLRYMDDIQLTSQLNSFFDGIQLLDTVKDSVEGEILKDGVEEEARLETS